MDDMIITRIYHGTQYMDADGNWTYKKAFAIRLTKRLANTIVYLLNAVPDKRNLVHTTVEV